VIRIPPIRPSLSGEEQRALWDGTRVFRIEAGKDIAEGEELLFNYCTTEYAMDEAFDCLCGSPACYGKVQGFKFLTRERKIALLPELAHSLRRFIQTGLVEKKKAALTGDALGVFAAEDIPSGSPILDLFPVAPLATPTRYTLQLSQHAHVRHEDLQWSAFLNHSCDGNVRLDFPAFPSGAAPEDPEAQRSLWDGSRCLSVVTTRAVAQGEEITFDYCTTEWKMAEPFDCACGKPACRGRIEGFSALTQDQKQALQAKGALSPSLQ
jgi:hypothetical protein